MPDFSFRLLPDFIDKYKEAEPPFGFRDAGGNSLGEITFIRTYSRVKDDGTKEKWWEVCERVINGMYTIQKDWAKNNKLPWNDNKAQTSAKEAFDRMFNLKWTPPGRGLWVTGTKLIHERNIVAGLYNCSFISTGDMEHRDPGAVFAWVMDALMLGVGVGFDTRGEAKGIRIGVREDSDEVYQIPDTREGWAESIRLLLNSYLRTNKKIEFDYSLIRPYGEPIKGFGGTASGPEPLIKVHRQIEHILDNRPGEVFDARAIVDMVNLIGTCVVAGNVRRSATIALGKQGDNYFIELKNYEKYPERAEWGWMCLPDDTWVHTLDGPKQIKSLINTEFVAMVNGQPYSTESVGFFSTGTRDVYRVSTKQGYSVDATDNHPILTEDGFVSVADLNVGDKIVIADQTFMTWGADDNSFAKGYVIGSIWGDGWITGNRAYICLYGDEATTNRLNELEQYAKLVGAQGAFQSPTSQNEHRLASKVLFSVAASYGFSNKGKRISAEIESESSEFYRGFLRAAFDADGTVAKYRSGAHGGQVILSQSNYQDLQAIQRMLLRLGIYSTIREASSKFGYGNKKQPYTLAVSARSLDLYVEHIGFSHEGKARRLKEILSARKIVRDIEKTYYATIDSIEWVSEREVYDVTINEKHMFDANGILVHNSNNTVVIDEPGYDYADAAQRIADNGEPGFLFLNTMQQYGRLKDAPDNKDWRVLGTNPCAEISLESRELCNLVEIHLNRHDSIEDYLRTIKFAYLYAKSITLLPTHWPETNAVIQRNRRIGTSMTGIAGFVDKHGLPEFRTWADNGYDEIQKYDKKYSEWLGIRESIRTTTVKPSGSVSLLSGATPGVHWPSGGKYYLRAIRFANSDPMLTLFKMAWYRVEPDQYSDNTSVVYFPVKTDMDRSEKDVSIYEKIHLAAEAQNYWSDNSVSVTVTFDPETERDDIARVLKMYEGNLKTVSFLPMSNEVYPQMPYTEITEKEYHDYLGTLLKIDFDAVYDGVDNLEAEGERYCDGTACKI